MRRLMLSFLAVGCFVLFTALPVGAQTVPPSSLTFNPNTPPPDINSIPALANMVKAGAKLFYMGERSGLFGWFIIKDGQVQMVYVTSDKKTTLIGGMFTNEGDNVTGQQITTLIDTNKEVADLVNSSAKQREDVLKAGVLPGGFASVPGGPAAGAGQDSKGFVPGVALSPGERLLQDLRAAAGVELGQNENAEINIIISSDCPHCKATWRELRDAVAAHNVRVRLIPVARDPGNNEEMRLAAQLLKVVHSLEVWDKYVGGDKSVLAGEAEGVRLLAVSSNNALADKWNIKAIPYLVYRAKDGRVKIVQGKPERMAAVLSDLLR